MHGGGPLVWGPPVRRGKGGDKGGSFLGEGQPCARLPACWSIYRSVVTCGWFIQLLNLCLGTMANDEKNPYDVFCDFSYRKILCALLDWDKIKEEEERRNKGEEMMEIEGGQQQASVALVDKRQLVKNFLQEVNDLYPLPKTTTLNSTAIKFYQLKKELLNCDPNWKFMTSNFRYLGYILPLLDAMTVASETELPDVSRCVKICMKLYHETRYRKEEDPLWTLDVERVVEFLYPRPPKEEEEEKEGGEKEEEILDKV